VGESRFSFPNPREATDEGLLCIGGDLEVPTLLQAYGQGIFPWPHEGYPLLWFSPLKRGILDFAQMHVPRRLLRLARQTPVRITFNQAFSQVIHACRTTPRSHEKGTWILPAMEKAYVKFHQAGYAHSVEAWQDDVLVGGLYGVAVQGVFSGESMFYNVANASKLCLLALAEALQAQGYQWMDTQMVTPVVEQFGGKMVSREEFLLRLEGSHRSWNQKPLKLPLKL
jgi:leucyl/phenylalanyl-tRNA--protein transferase